MSRLLRIATPASLACVVAFLLAGPAQAQHPTAVTSIVNSDQDTTLEVNQNGSLLAPGGTFKPVSPSDFIPREGAGTRLMWYPAKAAFRAGRVGVFKDGTQWDADSIGRYSVAFSQDTKATGIAATAMGSRTVASGGQSVTMGMNTRARASRSTAMGLNTTAATQNSLSIGRCNNANTSTDRTLFVIGYGGYFDGSCTGRSDVFVVNKSGSAKASSHDTFSDRRLKTAIEPLDENALKKLADLRPVRYEFKDQQTHPSGEQIGLIAQDVRKEFPQLVARGSGGMLSLAYPKMTAVLLKGLQEQQSTIDSLEGRVQDLEEQQQELDRVKSRLAALETGRSPSALAGLTGPAAGMLLAFLLGGLFGAGVLWRRMN